MNNNIGNEIADEVKDKFEKITFNIKEEIRMFTNDISTAKDNINKLDEIAKEINSIARELRNVKNKLNDIQKESNRRTDNIDRIWSDVKKVDIILGLNPFEQMFKVIKINLPDDIDLVNDDTNEKCKRIIQKNEKKEKSITIGRIEAIGDKDIDFVVKIEVNDFIATTQIENISKIYTIINFINEKLNYKRDEFTVEKKYDDKNNMAE